MPPPRPGPPRPSRTRTKCADGDPATHVPNAEEISEYMRLVPFGDLAWSDLNGLMLRDVKRAGTEALFRNAATLPEAANVVPSVRDAWLQALKAPWPPESPLLASFDATLAAMWLDGTPVHGRHVPWLKVDGIGSPQLAKMALFLVRHFGMPLEPLRGLVAAKAAQNDIEFFRSLVAAHSYFAKRKRREGTLAQNIVRGWLPLGLWLMNPRDAHTALTAFYEHDWTDDAFRKALRRLPLVSHPATPIIGVRRVRVGVIQFTFRDEFSWLWK